MFLIILNSNIYPQKRIKVSSYEHCKAIVKKYSNNGFMLANYEILAKTSKPRCY